MNLRAANNSTNPLNTVGFAVNPADELTPLNLDAYGNPVPAAQNAYAIQSSGLDIRRLSAGTDGASITGSNLDIRRLSGNRDAVTAAEQSSVTASASASVGLLIPVNILPTDLSRTRQNAFVVANRAILSLSVRILLQIAPVDINNYYVNDGSSYDLIGGGVMTFVPTKLMRFARIRVSALLSTATVEVYFFGRT